MIRLAVGVITVILTLLLIGLIERDANSKVAIDCFDATERERVRDISLKAIDTGLEQAVAHLYGVWQKDPDHEQPARARVGITNALNAHARARKFALDWQPPGCESKP